MLLLDLARLDLLEDLVLEPPEWPAHYGNTHSHYARTRSRTICACLTHLNLKFTFQF